MSYYCKAARDCGCTIWNYGRVCDTCIEDNCLDLIEKYDLEKCTCGAEESPVLYGEGVARQYVNHVHDYQAKVWSEFRGYIVECLGCGTSTSCFGNPDEAVDAWNNMMKV